MQNEKDKNNQIHKHWTRIRVRVRVRIWCWIRGKAEIWSWFWSRVSHFTLNNPYHVLMIHECLLKNLVVVLLTLNKFKTYLLFCWLWTDHFFFSDVEQVKKLVVILLTLSRLILTWLFHRRLLHFLHQSYFAECRQVKGFTDFEQFK